MLNIGILFLIVIAFVYFSKKKPFGSTVGKQLGKSEKSQRIYYDVDDEYNDQKVRKQRELDSLLDKIGQKGIKSLSQKEKQKLEEYSK